MLNAKKKRLASNVASSTPGLDLPSLRTYARTYPKEFMAMTQGLIDKGDLRWADVPDLKGLWLAMRGVEVEAYVQVHGETVRVMSSAFPLLAGNLTVAGINDAYMGVATVGDRLCTDFDSAKETATIAGLLAESKNDLERKEGEPFTLVGAGEERFDIGSNPKGLRMQITQEMIDRNEVENVVQRVNFLGEVPAEQIEKTTLREVTDHDGSAASGSRHVLVLNKTNTPLFSASANTPGKRVPLGTRITSNALVDETDLENARIRLLKSRNSRGERISLDKSDLNLLVPAELEQRAESLLGSNGTPGVVNEHAPWGPQGTRRQKIEDFLIATPKLSDLSTGAWYYGAFRKQFRRKWGLRIETVTQTGDLTKYLENRIAFEARVAWDCKVGAQDYVYVIQSLAASTAPKDE